MIKEYKTIREISGPLMVIKDVEGVTYDELAEIELPNGETRRCKVLEVNGSNAVVQLFDSSTGINLANSKIRNWYNNINEDKYYYIGLSHPWTWFYAE